MEMNEQLQIILVDNLKVRKINLQIGDNIIGNDTDSERESDSILENAVKLSLSDYGEMSITPYVRISCYMKSYGSLRWTLLKPNEPQTLRLRDTCLLYPIKIWFRVISPMEVTSENSKRKIEEAIEDEPLNKKYCSEYAKEVECSNGFNNNSKEISVNECIDNKNKYKEDLDKCEIDLDKGGNNLSKCDNDLDKYKNDLDSDGNNDIKDVLKILDSKSNQPEICVVDAGIEKMQHCNEPNISEEKEASPNIVLPTNTNKNSDVVQCNIDQGVGDQLNNSDLSENPNIVLPTDINENSDVVQCNIDQGVGDQLNNSDLTENQEINNDNTTSTSNVDNATATTVNVQNIPREKCKYGSQCYRRNAEHKAKFSHVGDDDYDVPDIRPECQYGMNCYRTNPLHRQHYKHTRNIRQAALRTVSLGEPDSDESIQESVDESDYDQSFIDDDDLESLEEFESDFED